MTQLNLADKAFGELVTGDVFSWGSMTDWYIVSVGDDGLRTYLPVGGSAPWYSAYQIPNVVVAPPRLASAALAGLEVDKVRQEADEARRRLVADFEQWKENATRIAHQYADDNSLCGEFDRCMEEIGLEGRNSEYSVTLTFRVDARDEDAAIEYLSDNWTYTSDLVNVADVDVMSY